MAEPNAKPLLETYHDWAAATIGEDGFSIPHGLVAHADGTMTVVALAVPPAEAYAVMLAQWDPRTSAEMIFALDRYARPGQGTTLGDLLAGFHFTVGAAPRPFIIEYQYEPRIFHPICWENPWWNAGLVNELTGVLRNHLGITAL